MIIAFVLQSYNHEAINKHYNIEQYIILNNKTYVCMGFNAESFQVVKNPSTFDKIHQLIKGTKNRSW